MNTTIQINNAQKTTVANTSLTSEQIAALISVISSANPAILVLPEGKAFTDIKRFSIFVNDDGKGRMSLEIK